MEARKDASWQKHQDIGNTNVGSIVSMVMGSRHTRTLNQPKKAAAARRMLASAGVVMTLPEDVAPKD